MAGSSIWAPVGDKGPDGDQGPPGIQGPQGPQGGPGPDAATFLAFVADLQNSSDPTKGVALVGGSARTIDTSVGLRTLAGKAGDRVYTFGWGAVGDGGQGDFYAAPTDTTSVDDGFSVFVNSTTGLRWKLAPRPVVDVRMAGAIPDDTTDSTLAIQRAINWAGLNGCGRVLIPGKYVITDSLTVDFASYFKGIVICGNSAMTDRIRQTGTNKDAFLWSTTQYLRSSHCRDLSVYCEANAGSPFNYKFGLQSNTFVDVIATALNPTMPVYKGIWSTIAIGQPCGAFNCKWSGGEVYITAGHTTFAIDFVCNGTVFNENSFTDMTWNNGGTVQFMRLTNVDTGTYLEGNTVERITLEHCKGGGIFFTNSKDMKIDKLAFWDMAPALYGNHLVHAGGTTGLPNTGTVLSRIKRNGDALTAGFRDIYIQTGVSTTVINCFTDPANNPSYDWNNNVINFIGRKLALANELNYGNRQYLDSSTTSNCSGVFTGSTGAALAADKVASITRSAAGVWIVTPLLAKANTNYRVAVSVDTTAAVTWSVTKTTSVFTIRVFTVAGAAFDPSTVSFDVFG